MAIFSLNHRTVGRTTHAPRTASFNARYITREEACTKILGARMPLDRNAMFAWLDEQEDGDRKNARVIDKVMVALPLELSHEQRLLLTHAFAEDLTKGRASWVAGIHDGPEDADNPHAHLIFRDRDVQTGKRVMQLSEKGSTERLRIAWERHINQGLKQAGYDIRVDRRSLAAQGIDREAQIHVGQAVRALDADGKRPKTPGRTRLEKNSERKQRNAERQKTGTEPSLEWAGRGGMVAEQRSAMEWIRTARGKQKLKGLNKDQEAQAQRPSNPTSAQRERTRENGGSTDQGQER
jgi:hypothetical protein